MVIWSIFRRDIRRLSKNFIAMVVIIGMCFIPALYAWFNIEANIDPYSNTKYIRVAVVNNDGGLYSDLTGEVDLGSQVVKKLKQNHQLGWQFVSRGEAMRGVRAGDYYAAIVIPEGFSKSILSILSGKLERPKIVYYCNEKMNAVAPKVTDTGATTLQTQINETFVKTVSETLSEELDEAKGVAAKKLGKTQRSLNTDLQEASDSLGHYQDLLGKFRRSSKESRKMMRTTYELLDQVDQSAEQSLRTMDQADADLEAARKSTASYTKELNNSLNDIQKVFNTLRTDTSNAAGNLNAPIAQVNGKIQSTITALEQVIRLNGQVISDMQELDRLVPGSPASDLIAQLQTQNRQNQAVLDALSSASDQTSAAARTALNLVTEMNRNLSGNEALLRSAGSSWLGTTMPQLDQSLDRYASLSGTIRSALGSVPAETKQIRSMLQGMEKTLRSTDRALRGTASLVSGAKEDLDSVRTDLNTIASSTAYRNLLKRSGGDAEKISDFLSSPITLKTITCYPVKNYGSAMTPFYTNLALWVSGIVLAAIIKLRVDADEEVPRFTATQAYLGRGLLFVVLGLIQALITVAGDLWLLHVQCLHPGMFILAGLITSFVYVNLIYAITICFNHIGRALVVLLVILQIPGSSGTYPIEMTPRFFRILHPLMPFTYSINAMRETIAGYYDHAYWENIGILLIFLGIAWFLGLVLSPLIMNMNNMFDDRLSRTGLLMSERENDAKPRQNLSHILWVLTEEKATRDVVMDRAIRFEANYKKRIFHGFLLYIILPLIFLALAFTIGINRKLIFLILWVTSLVVISIYLVILEYVHETLQQRLGIQEASQEDLLERIRSAVRDRMGRNGGTDDAASPQGAEAAGDPAAADAAGAGNDSADDDSATDDSAAGDEDPEGGDRR